MAQLDYNSVAIDFLRTRSVRSDVAYTPDEQDYLGTDHTIYVEGTVWENQSPVATNYNALRHALEQPRKSLRYSVDGVAVVESNQKLDLSNGPHPKVISIERVIGTG